MKLELDQLPPVLIAEDLAAIYRVSKETIRRRTAEGYFRRIEGFHDLRYRRSDILPLIGVQLSTGPDGQ